MVQIKSLVFKGDESITLVSLRTGDIVLLDHKRYLLTRAAGKTER
jgi:NMD protein affecting ribosome stability and mRNA decay